MVPSWRFYLAFLVCCALSVAGVLAATASHDQVVDGASADSLAFTSGFFSVPGVQQLDGGQQLADEARSDRVAPEAVAARERSRTAYRHLGSDAAVRVAQEKLPAVVAAAPGGLGKSPAGVHVVRYLSSMAAQVTLPGGKHGMVESLTPIATPRQGGRYVPVDLSLRRTGDAYAPSNSDAEISIPKSLQTGAALSTSGISLTPVDSSGHPLQGAGQLQGAAVVYPNSQTDTDTAIKATASGFEAYDLLRSRESPDELSFKIGAPHGASVVPAEGGSGSVRVVVGDRTVAVVPAPQASDASGAPVPVSTTLSGQILHLNVAHRAGDFSYPIAVDPTVIDTALTSAGTNWRIEKGGPEEGKNFWGFDEFSAGWAIYTDLTHQTNQWGALLYPTQGESHIYEVSMETSAADSTANVENHIAIFGKKGTEEPTWEGRTSMGTSYARTATSLCLKGGCPSGEGTAGNVAGYWVNAIGTGAGGEARIYTASVYIAQTNGPTASYDTTDATFGGGVPNVLYGGGNWWGPARGELEAIGKDPGVGVREMIYEVGTKKWTVKPVGGCPVECPENEEQLNGFKSTFGVGHEAPPDGEPTMTVKAVNGMGSISSVVSTKIKADGTAPYELTISGLPSGNSVTDANRTVKIVGKAKDGSGSTPSSGIGSLKLSIDGKEVGSPSGSCSPGPCTATGEWTFSAEDYPEGSKTLVLTASDGAENKATAETTFAIHHASTTGFGPGQINPVTGEFDLQETDVSVPTANSSLQISRSFNSRETEAGAEGPLGTPWTLTLGGAQSIVELPNSNAMLVDTNDHKTVFVSAGGGHFTAPAGDTGLVLTKSGSEYKLLKKGTTVTFTHVSGDVEGLYRPTLSTDALGTNSTFYGYQVVAGITEPVEVLAPVPAGVSCSPELKPGCRALTFNYATSTTASGEGASQWGDYKGRLTRVYLNAYDPVSKAMKITTIAQYAYDSKGRLRAEWDPRISPALKTTYGYDAEGHVTVLVAAGHEPWIFTYGTTASDGTAGRLLKLYRPPASEALWAGSLPANTEAPKVSGTARVGVRLSVSDGKWSNAPLTYGYQWEDCLSSVCTPIPGANNANYTPKLSDVERTLEAVVTATNGGGSVTAASSQTGAIEKPYVRASVDTVGITAAGCVPTVKTCALGDSNGNAYYSTNVTTTAPITWTSWTGPGVSPSEATACPSASLCLMAAGKKEGNGGNLYYATSLGGAWTLAYSPTYGVDAISCPSTTFCVVGQDGSGGFRYSTNPASTSWTVEQQGSGAVRSVSCLSSSFCAMGDSVGNLRVATSTAQIESSAWKSTNVDGTKALVGVGCLSTTLCVATDETGSVLKVTLGASGEVTKTTSLSIDGSNQLTAITCPNSSLCVATDKQGNVFNTRSASAEPWTNMFQPGGELSSLSCIVSGELKTCIAGDAAGFVTAVNPTLFTPEQGEARSPQPGTTIEYGVAVSGSGAPYQMGSTEVAKWAQTDVPVEATAVFPPDEPMGWPASDYRRASVYYLDGSDRVVNTTSPNGGIATREYNSYGDEVRSLAPDNREAAVKEGAKSAEVSQTLDTQSTYGSEGTELLETLGPLHTVKLANGTQVQARHHTVYSYDESAPSGGPYRLVTKVTDGAQIVGQSEADVRTRKISFAGQNNLGWILRAPTSTTVDPSGLKRTTTTVYDPASGNVTETRTPGAGAPNEELPSYTFRSTFGTTGSGEGQLSKPRALARDASGNIWVADAGNNRVEEFSSGGTFIQAFGKVGTNAGLFKEPMGIAIDGKGNVWVADTMNNRIEEFSNTGTFLFQFKSNAEHTLLALPMGIAIRRNAQGVETIVIADLGNSRVVGFSLEGAYVATYASSGTTDGKVTEPQGVAVDASGNIWIADSKNNRVQEINGETLAFMKKFGSLGTGNGQLKGPDGLAINSEGNVLVADTLNGRMEEFYANGEYVKQFGAPGSGEQNMTWPNGVLFDASNQAYVVDLSKNRIQIWAPNTGHESAGTGGTYGKQTIYYTTAANAQVPTCGEHPEWAGLPCQAKPAAQPETSGVPNLPVTTLTYDMGDEPLTSIETVGTTTRTTTNTYDEAERPVSVAVTSTVGTALPTTKFEYNSETGALAKQNAVIEGVTKSIETGYDKRGELVSYKDADGNTSTRTYDVDGRPETVNDGKGTQTYSYDTTTGLLTKLVDSAAGTFTASYDSEGNLVTAGYPNGMNVNHTLNAAGDETGVEYVKTTNCSSGCTWYSQTEAPSIHGQTLSQSSTFSSQAFAYDEAGRLTTTQDTPAGEGCTTRIYAYDVETNISSLTTRSPGAGGVCATEGGTAVNHSYDLANRLTDAGIAYNTFGDITTLPASDAGGSQVTSSYYVDETLAGQTQNGQTIGYGLDPTGRTRQTVSTGTVNSTVTSHYVNDSRTVAWSEDTGGKWTRLIQGLEGGLVAVQSNGENPVLQIEDLHGNVVATASLSQTAGGLLTKSDTTEYGVPRTGSPPKYSWQGANTLPTELPSGIIAMGARSYVPQIGRFLQPDPVEGGSANAYAYTFGDPVGSHDPSGEFTVEMPEWVHEFLDEQAEVATEEAIERAAEEQAAREEAEEKAAEAAAEAAEAAAEAAAGGGSRHGHHHHSGGGHRRGAMVELRYHSGGGRGCDAKCHEQAKEEKEVNRHKRVKKRVEKEEKEKEEQLEREEIEAGMAAAEAGKQTPQYIP